MYVYAFVILVNDIIVRSQRSASLLSLSAQVVNIEHLIKDSVPKPNFQIHFKMIRLPVWKDETVVSFGYANGKLTYLEFGVV